MSILSYWHLYPTIHIFFICPECSSEHRCAETLPIFGCGGPVGGHYDNNKKKKNNNNNNNDNSTTTTTTNNNNNNANYNNTHTNFDKFDNNDNDDNGGPVRGRDELRADARGPVGDADHKVLGTM